MSAKFAIACCVMTIGLLPVAAVEPVDVDTPLPIAAVDLDTGLDDREQFTWKEIPVRIRRLHGRRVSLRAYMYPCFEETGLSKFVAVVELKCDDPEVKRWGSPMCIHRFIEVQLRDGETIDYTQEPQCLEGRLFIDFAADDDGVYRLYKLTNANSSRASSKSGFCPAYDVGC